MVLVNVNDLGGNGHYFYKDLTHRGLDGCKWIIIEPQTTSDNQETGWVEQWSFFAVSALDV